MLRESAAMGQVNASNHVATHFRSRTRKWINWRLLLTLDYIRDLPTRKQKSWTQLVLWASTTPGTTATQLLPRFSSLAAPPHSVLATIEALIVDVKGRIGPLPVTAQSLKTWGHLYLPWLHYVLVQYGAAEAAGQEHPKLFSILPQIGNQPSFIAISIAGLHR